MAQENWGLAKDLNEDWLYYDDGWLPVTDRFDTYDAIFFRLSEAREGQYLLIKYPDQFSVFVNQKILFTGEDSLLVSLDSLFNRIEIEDPVLVIYAEDLVPEDLRTHLLFQYNPSEEPVPNDVLNVLNRKNDVSIDFSTIAFLIMLLLLVILKTLYPRHFLDFYNIRKAISSRDVEEEFLRGRLFSQVNLGIMLFQCMVIGLFIVLLTTYLDTGLEKYNMSLYDYFALWLRYSFYVMVFIVVKYVLIRNFTSLYNLYNFSTPHFMSYLRFLTISFSLGLIILYGGIYIAKWHDSGPFDIGLNMALVLLGFGIVFIYLKLMNSASYKSLHLFSYLCATEILPYVVLLKVAINQSI